MSDNPCIAAVARILRSNEPLGALATILFDHYSALSLDNERSAFTIALIGELLVYHARQSETAPSKVSEGGGAAAREKMMVTIDMIGAGIEVYRSWNPAIDDPETMIAAVFMAMRDSYFSRNSS